MGPGRKAPHHCGSSYHCVQRPFSGDNDAVDSQLRVTLLHPNVAPADRREGAAAGSTLEVETLCFL